MDPRTQIEAIVSEPNFEIITTFAYSTGLPHNATSLPGSHCYLLQYGIDRLAAAALDLGWTTVFQNLSPDDRPHSLAAEINAHMLSTHGETSKDPERRFIVRLAFKKDGVLNIMSGPRPTSTAPYYPLTLSAIPPANPEAPLMPVYLDLEPTTPSLLTTHKTSHRQLYNAAWNRVGLDETASPADCDVLLQNGNGHLMGAVFRTVYLWRDGGFVTPGSETGCKTGVSRRWAVENAGVKEAIIAAGDVKEGEMVWLSSVVGGFIQGLVTLKRRG